jgi:hypothetical protein
VRACYDSWVSAAAVNNKKADEYHLRKTKKSLDDMQTI